MSRELNGRNNETSCECDSNYINVATEVMVKTCVSLLWATSLAAKCSGDFLAWCGDQGLSFTNPRQIKKG